MNIISYRTLFLTKNIVNILTNLYFIIKSFIIVVINNNDFNKLFELQSEWVGKPMAYISEIRVFEENEENKEK